MATKSSKTTKTTTTQEPKKTSFAENYGSTILGFIVVLILGSFLFNVFRGNQNGQIGSGEETQNQENQVAGRTHTVAAGEDLWKISEKYYNTGYNWTDIAKANNITDANQIEEGQTLVIPEVTPAGPTEIAQAPTATQASEAPEATTAPTATVAPSATKAPEATVVVTVAPTVTKAPEQAPMSTSGSYTVQKGDSLWSIAVKEYNDGYKWVEIARANKLAHPDFIHVGNVLTLPR